MDKGYEKLFRSLKVIEPPEFLRQAILVRIETARKRAARIRIGIFSVFAGLSLTGAISTLIYIINSFSQSGFYQYVQLIFSDGSALTSHWQDFILTLVESLPSWGVTLFLALSLAFIVTALKAKQQAAVITYDHKPFLPA